ncbi:MAG: DUF6106 family protein [Porcipelethomonas sp.]
MDTYSEQLVKKAQDSSDAMKRVLIIVGGAIVVFGLLYVTLCITPFALIAVAAAIYGIFILFTGTNVEYEYIVTNSSLDIDKIISKRKRVNLISVDVREFTEFGEYTDKPYDGTIVCAAGGDEKLMYADFNSDRYGKSRLVFSPNEKVLGCIRPYLQRKIRV